MEECDESIATISSSQFLCVWELWGECMQDAAHFYEAARVEDYSNLWKAGSTDALSA